MKWKTSFVCALYQLMFIAAFGQIEQYDYQHSISGIINQWHSINLPEPLYEKINPSFSDLRIFGITAEQDTIEAPYLLKIEAPTTQKEAVDFKVINKTLTKDGHYFTFELASPIAINHLQLDLREQNFDWNIKLEGSQNQQNWFIIKDDYRIISIKNQLTDYQFTTLQFPSAKYRFYRLLVKTSALVTLNKATLDLQNEVPVDYIQYPILQQKTTNNRQRKTTVISLELAHPVPISFLKIAIANDFDFYRPVSIKYLKDSIKTEKGWHYQYENLQHQVLNSLTANEFTFKSIIAKKLRIIIQNQDNPLLSIDTVSVRGYRHQLITRFNQPAAYYLVYGRKNAPKPHYDLQRFRDKIPTSLTALSLSSVQKIPKIIIPTSQPLFTNKWWLWVLMVVIILTLGWFTMKMLKES